MSKSMTANVQKVLKSVKNVKKQFGSKKMSKFMTVNVKNMFLQFGSKKINKFMTANKKQI